MRKLTVLFISTKGNLRLLLRRAVYYKVINTGPECKKGSKTNSGPNAAISQERSIG